MKKIASILWALAALNLVSCVKEPGEGVGGGNQNVKIPSDFNWKTVRDVSMSVGMPSVDESVDFAVVRVYSSPLLLERNIVAKGVVTPANPTFRTAFTLPTGVDSVFVQTTLPDGTVCVRPAIVASQIVVEGAKMIKAAARAFLTPAADESSMPDYPRIDEKSEGDFDVRAVIRTTPSSNYQLGASWAEFAAPAYYIPAGAEITANIDLNGGFGSYRSPILYVAGRLKLASAHIGTATLAVLPGGVAEIGSLTAQNAGKKTQPAIYVFAGGRLVLDNANLSCKSVVNCGESVIEDKLDLNNQVEFYNVAGASLTVGELEYSNSGTFYNDAVFVADEMETNSSVTVWNFENGELDVKDYKIEAGNTVYQQGTARIGELETRGKFYVNCYTYIQEIDEAENAKFFLASDACLEIGEGSFNNTDFELAAGSLFIAREYNVSDSGQGNMFKSASGADDRMPVVKFEKAVCRSGAFTKFQGPMEVVYDASELGEKYQIDDSKYFVKGAVLREKQMVNIPASKCNGGKGVIEQEPEPEPEYIDVAGALYTYCFEDNWPWTGDYDMNDVVVRMSVDRRESKQGLVESIRINWEPVASGSASSLAFAVQLDGIRSGQVASVETTNRAFGAGPFSGAGLEPGNEYAVIPLFNSVTEVFDVSSTFINTFREMPKVATTKFSTTVTFSQPVEPAAVLESTLNAFIVVNPGKATVFERKTEVHMAGYRPTKYGDVSGLNTVTEAQPYKYFVMTGNATANNGMMWGLMIPGEFRHPSERSDIRQAYRYFNSWAASGGTVHAAWYKDEAKDNLLFQ